MSTDDDTEDQVSISVRVPGSPEAAYKLFVEQFGDWWPPEYTFCGEALEHIGIEPTQDGRCFERATDGRELVWGTVILAEAPQALVFRWLITPDRQLETDSERGSEVTVAFQADGGDTNVLLVHSGLSNHGDGWAGYRDAMASEQGWPYCLEHFRAAAN
jgi:uncharacterized protein YndB with AHSA1/START domain